MTKSLELGDFLLSLIAALTDRAVTDHGIKAIADSPLARFWTFLTETEVELGTIEAGGDIGVAAVKIGARLQRDAGFKKQVQEKLRGELEAAQEHYAESRSVSDLLNKFNLGSEKIV